MNVRGIRRLELGLAVDPFTIATSTFQCTTGNHNQYLILSRAAGIAVKLPHATGSGTHLSFIVGTVCTTTPYYTITTNPTTDIQNGGVVIGIDNSATGKSFMSVAASSTIFTMNGTTQGGVTIGDWVEFVDIAANNWAVRASLIGSGSIATPWS